jgi:hypothetical protein
VGLRTLGGNVIFSDPRKLKEFLEVAVGPLIAIGTIAAAVASGRAWLAPLLTAYMDRAFAEPLAILAPVLAAFLSLWTAYCVLSKKSKLLRKDRFDLRVRKSDDLLGRDNDCRDLKALIEDSSLLLIDGESGSGKSSLLEFGLIPNLNQNSIPILTSDYSGDWDVGLATKIFDAAWFKLEKEDKTKIGFSERPAIGTVNADTLRVMLEGIGNLLGRMPVVILDQFDDYQLNSRREFLGNRRDWIRPTELVRRNRTWAVIYNLLYQNKIRLAVVTRSDASAGLHSIRLVSQPSSFTIRPLDSEWLEHLLEQITADDGRGSVIANPEAGWTSLKAQLERDLKPRGASAAVLLPQQVRIVFLGLRKLSSLTPRDYRRAASGGGVEALYIRDAIESAAKESGLSMQVVRAALLALVDRTEAGSIKTKVLSSSEVAPSAKDENLILIALKRLARDEVIREKPAPGKRNSRWQLDHDYIAQAVVSENRAANELSLQLQDGSDAWHTAGLDIRQHYRSLLPLSVQAKVFWKRVTLHGGFTYRPYRVYAILSTLRALPFVLVLFGIGWLWRENSLGTRALHIVNGLSTDDHIASPILLELWGAPSAVRTRVLGRLLESPPRLRDAGTAWGNAFTSLELNASKELADDLITRLSDKETESARYSLFSLLESAAARLDANASTEIAKALISHMNDSDSDAGSREAFVKLFDTVVGRLDANAAAEVAKDLRARLAGKDVDAGTRRSLLNSFGSVAERLDANAAAEVGKDLRARLADKDVDAGTRRSLLNSLGLVAERLDANAAAEVAKDLRARLAGKDVDAGTQQSLLDAVGRVAARLDANAAAETAKDLRARLVATESGDARTQRSLLNALGSVAERLDANAAAETAKDLYARLTSKDVDAETQQFVFYALGSVAERLDASGAAEMAKDLRARLAGKDVDVGTQRALLDALERVAERLDANAAAEVAKDLRARLAGKDVDAGTQQSLLDALGRVAERLDANGAAEVAKDLRARLTGKDVDAGTQQSLLNALGRVAERLDANGAVEVANDLRAGLAEKDVDAETQQSLLDALGRVAERLDANAAAEVTKELRARLAGKDVDAGTQQSLLDAVGRAAARLDANAAAETAKDLRARLVATENGDARTQRSLLNALGSLAERSDANAAAETAKDLCASLPAYTNDDVLQSLINALGSVTVRLDANAAAEMAKNLITLIASRYFSANAMRATLFGSTISALANADTESVGEQPTQFADIFDLDHRARQSLLDVLGRVAERLDANAAAEVAKDLRTKLTSKDANAKIQQSLLNALGSVVERLDANAAAEAAKDLRTRLASKDVNADVQQSLLDVLGLMAAAPTPTLADENVAYLRAAMGSIAWPTRKASESPVWRRLEKISGNKFNNDIQRLLAWLQNCCKLAPSAARPPF